MSEVRGSGRECQAATAQERPRRATQVQGQGRQPRGATPRPRSGAEAGRTPCRKDGGQEELPHVQGQGQRPRVPGCNGAGTAEKSYPSPRSGVVAERSCPASRLDSKKEHSWGSN